MYPWFTETLSYFQKRIANNQLHHGLLLLADKGLGVSTFINALTKSILCEHHNACGLCKACKLFEAQSHPDVKRVVSDKPSIGVDLIREVGDFVNSTSQLLNNKVVIIEDIERLTESSGNSLLKTLEEPSQNTYLILSTSNAKSVLATIKSRCEKITIANPDTDLALRWLSTQTTQPVNREGMLAFSNRPLEYLESLNDQKFSYHDFVSKFNDLTKNKTSAQSLSEECKDNAEKALAWTFQTLTQKYRQILLDSSENISNYQKTSIELQAIAQATDLCAQANIKVSQAGINRSLLLQKLFNRIQSGLSASHN